MLNPNFYLVALGMLRSIPQLLKNTKNILNEMS